MHLRLHVCTETWNEVHCQNVAMCEKHKTHNNFNLYTLWTLLTCHAEQGHDDRLFCSFSNKITAEFTGELILFKAVFSFFFFFFFLLVWFFCFIMKQHQQLQLLWKSHFRRSVLLFRMVKIQAMIHVVVWECCCSLFSGWRRTGTHTTPWTSRFHQSTTWSRRHTHATATPIRHVAMRGSRQRLEHQWRHCHGNIPPSPFALTYTLTHYPRHCP